MVTAAKIMVSAREPNCGTSTKVVTKVPSTLPMVETP